MSKIKLMLLFGGESSEHEVSILSASNVFKAINNEKFELTLCYIDKSGEWWLVEHFQDYNNPLKLKSISPILGKSQFTNLKNQDTISLDVILPILHGENGEDGTIQGLAKLAHIPIVGCDIQSSSICIDKVTTKQLLEYNEIITSPYIALKKGDDLPTYEDIVNKLGDTIFVKPSSCGSSVGISKATNEEEMSTAIKKAFEYDSKILFEKSIDEAKEIEVAVLGSGNKIRVSTPGEIKPDREFYDYNSKYSKDSKSNVIVPADISENISKKIQDIALKAYDVLNCKGLARVDFLISKEGQIYLNEINTMPGFTNISMYPKLWIREGINYSDLIEILINDALER